MFCQPLFCPLQPSHRRFSKDVLGCKSPKKNNKKLLAEVDKLQHLILEEGVDKYGNGAKAEKLDNKVEHVPSLILEFISAQDLDALMRLEDESLSCHDEEAKMDEGDAETEETLFLIVEEDEEDETTSQQPHRNSGHKRNLAFERLVQQNKALQRGGCKERPAPAEPPIVISGDTSPPFRDYLKHHPAYATLESMDSHNSHNNNVEAVTSLTLSFHARPVPKSHYRPPPPTEHDKHVRAAKQDEATHTDEAHSTVPTKDKEHVSKPQGDSMTHKGEKDEHMPKGNEAFSKTNDQDETEEETCTLEDTAVSTAATPISAEGTNNKTTENDDTPAPAIPVISDESNDAATSHHEAAQTAEAVDGASKEANSATHVAALTAAISEAVVSISAACQNGAAVSPTIPDHKEETTTPTTTLKTVVSPLETSIANHDDETKTQTTTSVVSPLVSKNEETASAITNEETKNQTTTSVAAVASHPPTLRRVNSRGSESSASATSHSQASTPRRKKKNSLSKFKARPVPSSTYHSTNTVHSKHNKIYQPHRHVIIPPIENHDTHDEPVPSPHFRARPVPQSTYESKNTVSTQHSTIYSHPPSTKKTKPDNVSLFKARPVPDSTYESKNTVSTHHATIYSHPTKKRRESDSHNAPFKARPVPDSTYEPRTIVPTDHTTHTPPSAKTRTTPGHVPFKARPVPDSTYLSPPAVQNQSIQSHMPEHKQKPTHPTTLSTPAPQTLLSKDTPPDSTSDAPVQRKPTTTQGDDVAKNNIPTTAEVSKPRASLTDPSIWEAEQPQQPVEGDVIVFGTEEPSTSHEEETNIVFVAKPGAVPDAAVRTVATSGTNDKGLFQDPQLWHVPQVDDDAAAAGAGDDADQLLTDILDEEPRTTVPLSPPPSPGALLTDILEENPTPVPKEETTEPISPPSSPKDTPTNVVKVVSLDISKSEPQSTPTRTSKRMINPQLSPLSPNSPNRAGRSSIYSRKLQKIQQYASTNA